MGWNRCKSCRAGFRYLFSVFLVFLDAEVGTAAPPLATWGHVAWMSKHQSDSPLVNCLTRFTVRLDTSMGFMLIAYEQLCAAIHTM